MCIRDRYGSGDEVINLVYVGENGNKYQRKHSFEGILPNLERRYRETESAAVRELSLIHIYSSSQAVAVDAQVREQRIMSLCEQASFHRDPFLKVYCNFSKSRF